MRRAGTEEAAKAETVANRLGWSQYLCILKTGMICSLLSKVDLLVPLSPDLCWCEHATGSAHVAKGSLTSTVSTTTRDTRNTGDGTSCHCIVRSCPLPITVPFNCSDCTHQYPRTQRMSGDQPSRSRHMAVSCSWPCQCGRSYYHHQHLNSPWC